jgi:hypothetical protein
MDTRAEGQSFSLQLNQTLTVSVCCPYCGYFNHIPWHGGRLIFYPLGSHCVHYKGLTLAGDGTDLNRVEVSFQRGE